MNDDERRRSLTEYAAEGARAQPPVFVGRGAVIKDVAATAGLAYKKWLSGAVDARDPGLTRLLQGAPGAGKTALLRHMQARWADSAGEPGQPIGLRIGVNDLKDAQALRDAIENALPPKLATKIGGIIVRTVLKLVPGFAEMPEPIAGAMGAAVDVASEARRPERQDQFPGPVVLMVDEAQSIAPGSKPAEAAQTLHEGRVGDIPILPVFAGLGYLHSHLQREGINISRYADEGRCIHTLGRLSTADCQAMFEGWLRHFNVAAPAGMLDGWLDALVRDSQGWPMHTNGFLRMLAGALAVSDAPASLAAADIDAVRRVAAVDRATYYNGRYRGFIQNNVRWAGRAMAALAAEGALLAEDATAIIQEVAPPGGHAPALFDALLERGFLQRQGTELTFACTIPSLVRHAAVTAMQRPALHTAATLGRADNARRLVAGGANLDSRDALGRTPLHIAAECRWADVAQVLLDAGARADASDAAGATPRDIWPECFLMRARARTHRMPPGPRRATSGRSSSGRARVRRTATMQMAAGKDEPRSLGIPRKLMLPEFIADARALADTLEAAADD